MSNDQEVIKRVNYSFGDFGQALGGLFSAISIVLNTLVAFLTSSHLAILTSRLYKDTFSHMDLAQATYRKESPGAYWKDSITKAISKLGVGVAPKTTSPTKQNTISRFSTMREKEEEYNEAKKGDIDMPRCWDFQSCINKTLLVCCKTRGYRVYKAKTRGAASHINQSLDIVNFINRNRIVNIALQMNLGN